MVRRTGSGHPRPGVLSNAASVAISLVVASWTLAGCGGATDRVDPASDAAFGASDQTYSVRGEVVSLPDAGPPPRDFKIHHEPIPDFIGREGTVFINKDGTPGMKAMSMGFPLIDPDEDIAGIQIGDKVRFQLEVKWNEGRPSYRVTAIEPLAADTELDFASPAAVTTPADP